jgi:hypothetical protein
LISSEVSRNVEGITGSLLLELDFTAPLNRTLKSSIITVGGAHFRIRLLNTEESGHNLFNFADFTAPGPAFENELATLTFEC